MFLHRFIFTALIFICGLNHFFSQPGIEPSKMRQFNITINFDDYTVKTQMLSQNKDICVNNERIYMWYGSQKIIETKGGYDGKLIHGTYRAFYLNSQLKEQGKIKYGLRNKEWKYWYPDGRLKEVINWKNGVKNGSYCLYNDYGELMAKSNFKKNKLNGWFYTYGSNGKIVDKKKYNQGDELAPKVKRERTKRIKTALPVKEKIQKRKNVNKKDATQKTPFFKRLFKKKNKISESEKPKKEEKKIITS